MKPAFVSDDGTVFDTEEACIEHEKFVENKHDALIGMIRLARLQVESEGFPWLGGDGSERRIDALSKVGVVAELIFAALDIFRKSGVEFTEKESQSGQGVAYVRPAEVVTLIEDLRSFFSAFYVYAYTKMESKDQAGKYTVQFEHFFRRLASED